MRLEEVLQRLPSGVAIAEAPGGKLLHVNPQVERIWGRSFAEVEGIGDYGIWQGLHADGRPLRPEEWPLARTVTRGEAIEAQDVTVVRADGSLAVVLVSSFPVRDDKGRVVAGVLTCSDVTEQRRREIMRRLTAEASAAFAGSLDHRGTLRELAHRIVPAVADWCSIDLVADNGALERLVVEHVASAGSASEGEPRFGAPLQPDLDPRIGAALRTGEAALIAPVDDDLLAAIAGGDRQRDVLRASRPHCLLIAPLVGRGGLLGAIVLVATGSRQGYTPEDLELARDLAARAAGAVDNARLFRDSQAAMRAKADFLSVISHELRTPLTAIIGFAELLALGVPEPVTERQREQVERIEISGRHLMQLIEDILMMASLETGRAHILNQRVEVGELLRRAEIIIRPMVDAKGLALHLDPVEPTLAVRSDPDKLLHVLLNLLFNAVKFTDHGSIRVTATQEGEHLVVRVRDTGIGVDPRHQDRIFDPFWQAEQPITRRVGGTGLGLAISRRMVELLGGVIEVERNPDAGSTFVVRVPVGGEWKPG